MILFRHPASLLRRTEPFQTALIAVAFWALAIIALTSLRYLHLWGMPQVVGVIAWATMACVVILVGLVGIRCLFAWRKSGSSVPVLSALGGMPGVLLFGAVASYLAIGVAMMDEASWQPGTAEGLKYAVLCFGVLVATAIGGRAVLERAGVGRLLQGVLVVLIASCAIILASPVLRDLGILAPYRFPFRLTGAFGDPNETGLVACMTAALAAALLTNGGPRALGWLGLVACVAVGLGTTSRTALVVLGAMAVLFLLLNVRGRPRGFVLAVAGTVLAGTAAFAGVVFFSGGPSEWSRWFVSPGAPEGELFCDPSPTDSPGTDCAVLLAARDVLAGDMALNWSRTVPVNRWRGVTVDGPEGGVTRLALAELGLNGRIPSGLGHLDRLVSLSLRRNRLTGRIPPELGNLVSLRHLALSFNALTGTIPPELAKLEALEELWLENNRLTGPVPVALGELGLSVLRLSGNDFDSIPSKAYGVPDHDLARTRLCLPLTSPALFGDCTVLLAAKDVLAGDAPLNWSAELPIGSWQGVTVGGVPERVTALDLSSTGLNGRIPPELGRLDGLVSLSLAGNFLTGPVPPELGRLVDLRQLSLDRNALTGAIPAELGQLFRLRGLWLRENRLTGPAPPALFEVPEHDLGNLVFCVPPPRTSPALFGDCTVLLAAKDVLAGDAPLNWNAELPIGSWQGVTVGGVPERVTALDLSSTGLNGRIPPELGRLDGLVSLSLAGNFLTGPVPPELGRLVDLRQLSLDRNALTGAIPAELGQLSRLRGLWLRENRLTGPAPPALFEVPEHDLGNLVFCAPPPRTSPALFGDCTVLLAAKDVLAGDAPLNWSAARPMGAWQGVTLGGPEGGVIALELPQTGLNGRVPAALGNLARLRALVLDGNALTGAIPPELGKLADLEVLGLASNALTGAVPAELAKLSNLRDLWLSGNRLTGSLPPELHALADKEASCLAAPAGSPGLRADCALLLANRDILAGDAQLNWSEDVPIEFWQGVTIGGSPQRVTRLELKRSGLNGRIPPELGRLNRLAYLDLASNRLTGGIPPELGALDRLVSLRLNRNRLTGPVPPELGELTGLEILVLSFNALSGPIPPELGNLSHLRELWLKNDGLTGPVPPELEGLDNLSLLRLYGNDLDRPYPRRLYRIDSHDLDRDDLRHPRSPGNAEAAPAAVRRTNEDHPDAVRRLFCRPASGVASDLQADCALLLAAKDVLAGDAQLNWSADIPIEFWQGVTIGGPPQRVTALELPRAGLNGRLFSELGELGGLVALDLSHNRLSGPIPSGLGRLGPLVALRLESNRLTGPIPPELEALDSLSLLRLAGNDFDRPFPPALHAIVDHDLDTPVFCRPGKADPGLLADCTLLLGVRDALAGDAPLNWRRDVPVDDWQGVAVGRSRGRVTALDLTRMGLNGRIPVELGRLTGLVSLRLGRNRLAGAIPPELGNLVDLRVLVLDGNLLAGSIPPELGKLSRLTDLWLHGNRLIGPVPPPVAALPELAALRLDDDEAAGELPAQGRDRGRVFDRNLHCQPTLAPTSRLHDDCATLLVARDVLAGDVELNWSDTVPIGYWRGVTVGTPPIASEAAEGPRVITLDLSHMGLNGRIPAELSALDALAVLRLGDNRLAGSIPPALGALTGLLTLVLENNALTGEIPRELGGLQALVSLRLGGNELTGRIPWELTTLANLRVLTLEDNVLTGNVQPRLGKLTHLEELRLENNRLHGVIPKELNWLAHLVVLRLGGNAFADCVPATARAAQVRHNDLDSADLLCESSPWTKPGLFEDGARLMRMRDILAGDAVLNWSYARPVASWQGVTIGGGGRVFVLDLRDMNLSGRIPPELGELSHLRFLRLDGNRLTGPIPPELGRLTRLEMLSLDGNRLTGPIPPEIAGLADLGNLWLADNRLTGSIPPELAGIKHLSLAVAGNDFDGCMPWEPHDLHDPRSHDIDDSLVCAALAWDRLLLWRLGFRKAMEAPVFGHGLGALAHMDGAPIGHHGMPLGTHNLYLTLLGDAGIVPLLLFLSAIVLLLRAQWGAPRSLARDAAVALVIVIALYCMTFQHLLKVQAFMFLAGLSVAMGAAAQGGGRRPSGLAGGS